MSRSKSLEQIADELYGVAPGEFVAVRDEYVARARADDRELADQIAALRRPTQSAWLVNLLWREHRSGVEELLELGEAFREAHRTRSGERIRELSGQRQRLVTKLAERARQLGEDAGTKVGASAVREVESSLEAAVADPDVAELVRAGQLTKPATYAGFGPVGGGELADLASVFDVPDTTPAKPVRESRELVEARKAVDRTSERLAEAEQATEAATASRDELTEQVQQTEAELRVLQRKLAESERELRTRNQKQERAKAAHDNAQQRLNALE